MEVLNWLTKAIKEAIEYVIALGVCSMAMIIAMGIVWLAMEEMFF